MEDKVQCQICKKYFSQLSSHLKNKHNMTGDEYRKIYPGTPLMSELLIYNNSGKNGSNWQGGKIILICEQCGKKYEQWKYVNNPRFCCIECKRLWFSKNKNESILICDQCGKEFVRQNSSINDGKNFCCRNCAEENAIGENAHNWQGGKITLICDQCGEKYERHKSLIGDGKHFCCHECHDKWISENLIGENSLRYGIKHTEETKKKMRDNHPHLTGEKSPHWKGGITSSHQLLISSEIYKQWRISVFERDNYTCQECGDRGCYLNCHHILPYRDYPEYEYSLNIDNGITLCVDCHRKTFRKEYNFVFKYIGIIFDNKSIKIFGDK